MAIPRRWRLISLVALAFGVFLVLGARSREDRFSCHLCRARKEVRMDWLIMWPVSRREAVSYPGRAGVGHGHDWWRYSYYYSNGFGGCLGIGVGCKPDRYRDGSTDALTQLGKLLEPDPLHDATPLASATRFDEDHRW